MQDDFFNKYMYLSLYCNGSKRVTQGLRVRGSWRPNRNCNILTPTLMAINVVSFSFSWCSTGGPGAQLSAGWWLSLLHFISNFSGPQLNWGLQLIRVPRPLRPDVAFPTTSRQKLQQISQWNPSGASRPLRPDVALPTTSRLSPSPTLTATVVLTELYNSSTPTQSPTWSLELRVGSSSSGNNCHAVHSNNSDNNNSNTYLRSSIVKTNAYWTGLVFMNKHIQLDVLANHNPRNGPANVCTLESPNVP